MSFPHVQAANEPSGFPRMVFVSGVVMLHLYILVCSQISKLFLMENLSLLHQDEISSHFLLHEQSKLESGPGKNCSSLSGRRQ